MNEEQKARIVELARDCERYVSAAAWYDARCADPCYGARARDGRAMADRASAEAFRIARGDPANAQR